MPTNRQNGELTIERIRYLRKFVPVLAIMLLVTNSNVASTRVANSLTDLVPGVGIRLTVDQITHDRLITDTQVTLINTVHPTNVSIVSTFVSDPVVTVNLSLSEHVSIGITALSQFSFWSNESGTLTSTQLSHLVIQSINSSFPNETINLNLFVGSNYTLAYQPLIITPVTYYVLKDSVTNLDRSYLNRTSKPPGRIVDLFNSYKHVALIDISIGHLDDFKSFVTALGYTPYFVAGLAALLFIALLIRFKWDVGPTRGESIAGLVAILLFVPIFILGVNQSVPAAGSQFLEAWLSRTEYLATLVFEAVSSLAIIGIAISFLFKKKAT